MTKSIRLFTAAAIALAVLAVAGFAVTEARGRNGNDSSEHRAFLRAGIHLVDAIAAAEAETGARAMSAEFEDEKHMAIYDVELLTPNGEEIEVEVDAATGKILSVERDDDDDDDDDDENDD